jgi:hypothetical protein
MSERSLGRLPSRPVSETLISLKTVLPPKHKVCWEVWEEERTKWSEKPGRGGLGHSCSIVGIYHILFVSCNLPFAIQGSLGIAGEWYSSLPKVWSCSPRKTLPHVLHALGPKSESLEAGLSWSSSFHQVKRVRILWEGKAFPFPSPWHPIFPEWIWSLNPRGVTLIEISSIWDY